MEYTVKTSVQHGIATYWYMMLIFIYCEHVFHCRYLRSCYDWLGVDTKKIKTLLWGGVQIEKLGLYIGGLYVRGSCANKL